MKFSYLGPPRCRGHGHRHERGHYGSWIVLDESGYRARRLAVEPGALDHEHELSVDGVLLQAPWPTSPGDHSCAHFSPFPGRRDRGGRPGRLCAVRPMIRHAMFVCDPMAAARKIIDRAREAGLSPELAKRFESELLPRAEAFLANAPEHPPVGAEEEDRLLQGLLDLYRPFMRPIMSALPSLADAMSSALDDLLAPSLQADEGRRRAMRHLEEAISSLIKAVTVVAAQMSRQAGISGVDVDVDSLPALDETSSELRTYLRGLLAFLVAFDRKEEDLERLVPWAWMARRELLKTEALVIAAAQQRLALPSSRSPRAPGGWKGRVRIADDFDDPLPVEIEDAFYTSSIDPKPSG
jgi:hypothetical protein